MSDELGTTVAEIKQNAQRLGLLTLLRPGTAASSTNVIDGTTSVLVDGDEDPIDVMTFGSDRVSVHQRVSVLFVEPHGAYIVGVISPTPSIAVTPRSGPDATAVTLSGDGWDPNTQVFFFWDGSDTSFCDGPADGSGHVEAGCNVPAGPTAGPHDITAGGENDFRVAHTTFVVTSTGPPPPPPGSPTLFVDPSSGPAPSNTSYSGAGWNPGAGSVSVDWVTPATHLADEGVDAMGNIISSSTTVPAGAAVGDHTVNATQGALTAHTIFHVTTGGGSTDPLAGHDTGWVDLASAPHWGWFVDPSSRVGAGLAYLIAQDVMNWLGPRVCSPWQRPSPTWDFYDNESDIPAGTWHCGFWGDVDVYGSECCGAGCCLGFHSVDGSGVPFIKVFTGQGGFAFPENGNGGVREIASHEAAETIVDPQVAWFAHNTAIAAPNCYIVEAGDPVAAHAYQDADFGNNWFTDVPFPDYFRAGSAGPWDLTGILTGPFTVASPGGAPVGPFSC